MKEKGFVKLEKNNGIALVTFYHPKSNSLPSTLLKKMKDEIESLNDDSDIKVIVIKSEGDKTFCAGASFDELLAINNFDDGKEFFMGFARLINAIRKSNKFVIGRIQGKAVGGGVGLISACDYSIAVKEASIRLSELALGIGAFVIEPVVKRKIGLNNFNGMSIDTEWRSAEWGNQHNLFTKLVNTLDELDADVETLSQKLSKYNPAAISELKKIFWRDASDWDELLEERAEISGRLVLSDYTKKYIAQFKNK